MCMYNYCNHGKSVIILGKHIDTEKKDSISQVYHETLTIMIIMTTDNARLHVPGKPRAKYFKWVVFILRITPLVDFISPIYW